MNPTLKFVIPPGTGNVLIVCKETHEAVSYFAKKYDMRMIEATQYLLGKALREEFGSDKKKYYRRIS